MIRLLVKWGADPDLRFPDGWTSRSSLKLENNQEMMDALLSAEKTATEAGSLPNELGSDRD